VRNCRSDVPMRDERVSSTMNDRKRGLVRAHFQRNCKAIGMKVTVERTDIRLCVLIPRNVT